MFYFTEISKAQNKQLFYPYINVAYEGEGEEVSFSCLSHERPVWYHGKNPLKRSGIRKKLEFPDVYTLIIPDVELDDNGQYICKGYQSSATNENSTAARRIKKTGNFEIRGQLYVGSE